MVIEPLLCEYPMKGISELLGPKDRSHLTKETRRGERAVKDLSLEVMVMRQGRVGSTTQPRRRRPVAGRGVLL